jgi:hypothetical protein
MITDQQFNDWAQSSTKNPVFLVEITHKDGTVYLSDRLYSTGAGETPEHVSYDVCLKDNVVVERTLNESSVSAVRVYNDGSLDYLLDLAWKGYAIEIFVGDKSWAKEYFRREYKGTVESLEQLSAINFEFKSALETRVVDTDLYIDLPWIAGNHTNTPAIFDGLILNKRMYKIAHPSSYEQYDVTVKFNGVVQEIEWGGFGFRSYVFYMPDHYDDTGSVTFECETKIKKFKELFADICDSVSQPYSHNNLADYPINPDVTMYINSSMTFSEFLTLTLDTLGAVLWINDDDEIEFYQKRDPDLVDDSEIATWIVPSDRPNIKTITTEDPASVVQVKNPDYNHNSEAGPTYSEYNALDLTFPFRTLITHSYAEDSYAIAEARRLADLLSVTRRTYSVSIDRISPEIHIGAIVNIYSPKDRWNNGTEGLNALVVGFTQSYKSNKSELIVWR